MKRQRAMFSLEVPADSHGAGYACRQILGHASARVLIQCVAMLTDNEIRRLQRFDKEGEDCQFLKDLRNGPNPTTVYRISYGGPWLPDGEVPCGVIWSEADAKVLTEHHRYKVDRSIGREATLEDMPPELRDTASIVPEPLASSLIDAAAETIGDKLKRDSERVVLGPIGNDRPTLSDLMEEPAKPAPDIGEHLQKVFADLRSEQAASFSQVRNQRAIIDADEFRRLQLDQRYRLGEQLLCTLQMLTDEFRRRSAPEISEQISSVATVLEKITSVCYA